MAGHPASPQPDMSTISAASSVPSPAGVHLSAWVAWASYATGFSAVEIATLRPLADLAAGRAGAFVLGAGIAAFFVCAIACQRHMGMALSSADFGSPSRLVRSGPFASTRNPIYLAFLLPILALAWYSPTIALASAALYVLTMNRFVIAGEERDLARVFGPDYADWERATPRWLPRWR